MATVLLIKMPIGLLLVSIFLMTLFIFVLIKIAFIFFKDSPKRLPMSEEFLGTRVRVILKDEQIVEGRVEAISERENLLLISSAEVRSSPQATIPTSQYPRLELFAGDIEDIEIIDEREALAVAATTVSPVIPPNQFLSPRSSSVSVSGAAAANSISNVKGSNREIAPPMVAQLPKPASKSREGVRKEKKTMPPPTFDGSSSSGVRPTMKILSRPQPPPNSNVSNPVHPTDDLQQPSPSKSRRSPTKVAVPRWNDADVSALKDRDFDFQANLDLFDKERIFSEMRAQDTSQPENRLHAQNINSQWRRLRHDENVLGPSLDLLKFDDDNEEGGRRQLTMPSNDDDVILLSPQSTEKKADFSLLNLQTHNFPVEALTLVEERLLHQGSRPVDFFIEAGGRSLAEFLLQNGSKMLKMASEDDDADRVLLYVSGDRLGAYTLCAGRHLLNRGIAVDVYLYGDLKSAPIYFRDNWRTLLMAGGNPIEKLPRQASLLINSMPLVAPVAAPMCALVPCPGALWQVRFGLLNNVVKTEKATFVICDVGWPATLVNDALNLPPGTYQKLFGFKFFSIVPT